MWEWALTYKISLPLTLWVIWTGYTFFDQGPFAAVLFGAASYGLFKLAKALGDD